MKKISVKCFRWKVSNYYLVKKIFIKLNLKQTGRSYLFLFQCAVLKHLSLLLMYFGLQQDTWDCIDPPSFKPNSANASTFYKFLSILKYAKHFSKKKKVYYLRILVGITKFDNLKVTNQSKQPGIAI